MTLLSTPRQDPEPPPAAACGALRVLPRARPSTGRASHAGRWSLLVSVLLHAAGVAVGWGFVARRSAPGPLEFRVEVAGVATDTVETVEPREPVEEPDPDNPLEDVLVDAARPTDAPLEQDLPELEAPPEATPPDWTLRVPSVTARLRPAPAPAPAEPPPAEPAHVAPAPAPALAAASAGAARVERASPLATNRRPAYPPESRRQGEQGIVVLRLTLGPDGVVTDVTLEQSSGWPRLDEAAIAAAWGWRFKPALSGGLPVASAARQRVTFRLDGP